MNEFVIKNGFISQGTSYVSDGNLGVGVSSPTSRLEVKGVDTSSSNYGLKVQNSGGTDNLVVRNDGNVGIGTSSPSEKLEVSGNTKLTSLSNVFKISSYTALGMSQGVGAANVFIGGGTVTDGTNGGGISIGSSSTTYGDGVSIGQTAKADSSGGDAIAIGRNSTANGSVRSIAIGRNSTSSASNAWALGYNTNATQDNTFIFGDSSDINIKSGFGTNTPEARIHIKGSDSSSSNYGLKVQNSGGTDNLVVRNDGNIGIGTSNPTQKLHILSYGTGGVLAQLNDAPFNVDLSGSYGQLKFTYGSDIEFSINPYPSTFNTSFRFKSNPAGVSGENGIEHSVIGVINGNGGLVIGESLNIGSTSAYTGTYHSGTIYGKLIQKSNFNNPNVTFYPLIVMDGNVGIGTSTPSNGKLEVVGGSSQGVIATSTNDIAVNGTSTGASSFGIKGESDLGTSIRSNVTNTSAIGLEVNYTPTNSSLFKVLGDGNVGIGTSAPSEKLDVSGKTKTTNFQMTSGGTEDYIMTSDSQGNGKWTPSYNLSSKDYGSFYDTTTQTGGNGTIQPFQLNSSGATKGISITDLTGITVTHTGVYNIQFSAQINDNGGTTHDVYIWLRKNGLDIPNSNSRVEVGNNNNYIVAAWNFVEEFNSNDVINLMWYSESNTISILYDATPTAGPEIPSLILTITQI